MAGDEQDSLEMHRNYLFRLNWKMAKTRRVIGRGNLACVTSEWLLSKVEAGSQAQPPPEPKE